MKILTDEDGNKYRIVTKGMQRANNTPQLVVEEILKQKTFSWDDVADGVLVDWSQGNMYSMTLNEALRKDAKDIGKLSHLRFSDKWNVWRGGECPLPKGVMVQARLRDVNDVPSTRVCDSWSWNYFDVNGDVIAYRVIGLAQGYVYPDQVES